MVDKLVVEKKYRMIDLHMDMMKNVMTVMNNQNYLMMIMEIVPLLDLMKRRDDSLKMFIILVYILQYIQIN
jgi:hypothetical protein